VRKASPKSPASDLTEEQIREALAPFGVSVAENQVRKIHDYLLLLLQWNRAMSLTTVTEPAEMVRRHFGESMFAAKLLPVENVENCRLADVGTGAGFPGLALKIAIPHLELTLIESNKKKCAFLAEVVRKLGFERVEIIAERFEDIRPERISANAVTVRALGGSQRLLEWAEKALQPGSLLVLWLGSEDAVRIAGNSRWNWQPAIRIPDSQRRYLLVGTPAKS